MKAGKDNSTVEVQKYIFSSTMLGGDEEVRENQRGYWIFIYFGREAVTGTTELRVEISPRNDVVFVLPFVETNLLHGQARKSENEIMVV